MAKKLTEESEKQKMQLRQGLARLMQKKVSKKSL